MHPKLLVLVAAAAFVSAAPTPADEPEGNSSTTNQCNVGKLQCCNSVQDAKSQAVQDVMGSLEIPIGSIQGLVGLTCNPISVIGIGAGANCNATPVCCEKNQFNGAIALGCGPINANL